jgi:hypothetical protein
MKHTPGPWDYTEGKTLFHVEHGEGAHEHVCSIPKSREADARLIAASPDLLEAAKLVLKLQYNSSVEVIMNKLAAAVAKAEGK